MIDIESIAPGDELRYHQYGDGTYRCRVLRKSGHLVKIQLLRGPRGATMARQAKLTVSPNQLSRITADHPAETADELERRLLVELVPTTRGGEAFRLSCPKCGHQFQLGTDCAGMMTRCRACGTVIKVPTTVASEPVPPPRSSRSEDLEEQPRRPTPTRTRRMRRPRCPVCGDGSMVRRRKHRLGGLVVSLGYLTIIAANLGLLACLVMFALVASAVSLGGFERELLSGLEKADVPAATIDLIGTRQAPDPGDLAALTVSQQRAVREARLYLRIQDYTVDLSAVSAGGGWLLRAGACLLIALFGCLLVARRTLLQCATCGAAVVST